MPVPHILSGIGSLLGGKDMFKDIFRNVIGSGISTAAGVFGEKYGTKARMDALAESGLTPQEAVGASGSGAGSGAGAAGLGMAQLRQQKELEIGRQKLTKRQQDIQADTARDVARINVQPALRRLDEIDLRMLPDQLKNLANQAATSHPRFVRTLKTMNMAPANLVATGVYEKYRALGFDMMSKSSWRKAPEGLRRRAMQEVLAQSSATFREGVGTGQLVQEGRTTAIKALPERIKEFGRSLLDMSWPN